MPLRFVRVLIVCVLGAAPLAAQQPTRPGARPPGQSGARGTVTGVVYDSLASRPLEGARVMMMGTTVTSVTDVGGRYRLDSVPSGPQVVVFEHDELDSIGLYSNPRRVQVAPGRLTNLELSTPSLATLRRSLCTGQPVGQNPDDIGIVFGTITDAASGIRLAGARAGVRWTTAANEGGRIAVERPTRTIATDSIGNFYLCGVPTQYVITVFGQAGTFTSGITEILLGERGISRRDIAISRDSTVAVPDSSGRLHGRATIIGTVVDENGTPRPSARASVDEAAAAETYADEDGRFVLNGLPAGSQTLMVRMIGYTAVRMPVMLRNDDTLRLTVRVRALTVLDTIRITASNRMNQILLDEMEQRRRAGSGYFIPGEQARTKTSMRSIFQGLPTLVIEGRSAFNFTMHTLYDGGPRPIFIYVDGVRSETGAIQSYRPDQIIGVEWFPRGQNAPLRYQNLSDPRAGVLLIWTRFMR